MAEALGSKLDLNGEGGSISLDQYMRHRGSIDIELDRIAEMWNRRWTKEYIHQSVIRGMWTPWFFTVEGQVRVVVYTQVVDYPAARVLWVPLCFGNSIDKLLPLIEATLERYGQECGCDECEIIGRRGWEKKLGHRFKARATLLVAPIPPLRVH